jgi:hypothetical protein
MKPHSVGRTLGIGLRVAGRIVGQHVAASAEAAARAPVRQPIVDNAAQRRAAGQAAGQVTRGVARGIGGFLRPFSRVGGILWLEVTGVFFFLFVIVFGRFAWITRLSYAQGPDHLRFLVYAGATLVFLYLTVSSFWRARRR